MAKKSATRADVDLASVRSSQLVRVKLIDGAVSVFKTLFRSATFLGVAFFTWLCVQEIAGKTTIFDLHAIIEGLKSDSKDRWFWIGTAIVTTVAYSRERRLRLRTVKEITARVKRYELGIDPGRSSSYLTATGQPTPKDKSHD